MKNILGAFVFALLSAGSIPTLASCDHHDSDVEISIVESDILGVWKHDSRHDDNIDYICFKANGVGEKWEVSKRDPNRTHYDYESFRYEIKGNYIYFTETDGEVDRERISITKAGKLRIDDDVYERDTTPQQ